MGFENSEGLLSSTASVPANAVSVLSVVENPRAVMAFIQSPQNAASFDRDIDITALAQVLKRVDVGCDLLHAPCYSTYHRTKIRSMPFNISEP